MITLTIKRALIFGTILTVLLGWLLLNLAGIYISIISSFLSILVLFVIPGYVAIKLINNSKIATNERLIIFLPASIAFLIIIGLAVNSILPILKITTPLTASWLTPIIYFVETAAIMLLRKRITNEELTITQLNIKTLNNVLLPLISLTVMVTGVLILNSKGSNILIVLGYILVILTVLSVINKREEDTKQDFFYLYALFFISLSLLFSYALRSAYVLGFDINAEMKIFLLTKEHGLWSLGFFKNAYNTCLSISILPTILSTFIRIGPDTLFKIFYPIVLSFIPPIIYMTTKILSSAKVAFFTALFFTIQSQFILQAPALSRQSVAFLFFAIILYLMISQTYNYKQKQILIVIFGTCMILSHYSTTYIAIPAIVGTYIITKLLSLTIRKDIKTNLSIWTIVCLFIVTMLWNAILTENSTSLLNTFTKTINNMGNFMSSELRSDFIRDAFFTQKENPNISLTSYYKDIKEIFGDRRSNFVTKAYPSDSLIPLINAPKISLGMHIVLPLIFRVCLFLGIALLTIKFKRKQLQTEYYVISMFFVTLVTALIVLPYISMTYNLERLYQQALTVLAFPTILVIYSVCSRVHIKLATFVVFFLTICYLLINVSFTDRFLAGTPNILLDNQGEHYDRYYKYEAELKAVEKLTEYYAKDKEIKINADRYAVLRISTSTKLSDGKVNQNIFPETIPNNSYTFLSTVNVERNKGFTNYNDTVLTYYLPSDYFNSKMNLVYSTKGSEIYK